MVCRMVDKDRKVSELAALDFLQNCLFILRKQCRLEAWVECLSSDWGKLLMYTIIALRFNGRVL